MIYSTENKRMDIAFKGKCIVRGERDEFYGGDNSQSYESPVIESPTWNDLCACARKQQKLTNDLHHNFFEDFYVKGKEVIDGEEVVALGLFLGS